MARRLAFVELPDQLEWLSGRLDYTIVSANPRVTVELDLALGIPYVRLEDGVSDDELERAGLANFAHVEALADAVDAVVRNTIGDADIAPARWSFYWLKMLFDAISLRARQVDALVERTTPGSVLAFRRAPAEPDDPVPLKASLLAPAVALAAGNRRIAAELVDWSSESAPATGALRAAVGAGRARAGRAVVSATLGRRRRRRTHVLCVDYGHSMPAIARALRRHGVGVALWPARPAHGGGTAAQLWDAVHRDEAVRRLFRWEGIDLWDAAEPFLQRLVEREVARGVEEYAAARELLQTLAPHAVLLSSSAGARENAICAAARRAEIPTILSRHGAGVGFRNHPFVAYIDLADWSLCWGRWEAEWISRHQAHRVSPVVVGAPMIENVAARAPERGEIRRRLGIGAGETVVLYIPTALSGNQWYASRRAPSDGRYFDEQKAIVATLAAIETLTVVVKEHPAEQEPSPLARWCAHLHSNVRVLRRPAFDDLLHLADAVVIDAPFTTLVQALFGSAHVYIVDDPVIDWVPGVVDHLRVHGVRVCPAARLEQQLRRDVDAGLLRAPARYGDAAREPFAAGGAGTAAERAAAAIVTIAGERAS